MRSFLKEYGLLSAFGLMCVVGLYIERSSDHALRKLSYGALVGAYDRAVFWSTVGTLMALIGVVAILVLLYMNLSKAVQED